MVFKDLTDSDKELIKELYGDENISKESAQRTLSEKFDTSERTVRTWANNLELNMMPENIINQTKILVYDIETARIRANLWWTGKQYVNHNQLIDEPKIITISWKWLNEDKISHVTWDLEHSDKKLMIEFLKHYNKADMVIGQNNSRFDDRYINARAMKYGLDVNVNVKSFDIMKQTKKLFRLPSYSMDYVTKFLGAENKMKHEGIIMWDKIQYGTKEEQKEYLQKMVDYNVQDIIATEDMYHKLRKYMGHKIHVGVLEGKKKYSCPNCGGLDIKLYKTTTTPAGTIQRLMKCDDDEVTFKLNNTQYLKFLDNA